MRPLVSLRRAFEDPNLLQPVIGGKSREPMRALLLASQGEKLTASELVHYRKLTGRATAPTERASELHIFAGRRSGKSSGIAALATYAGCLCDHSDRLTKGERGIVLVIAENMQQAGIVLGYIAGAIEASPVLAKMIASRTRTSIILTNNIEISVRSADWRSLRGLSLVSAIGDEICHWRSDFSANPAQEIITAITPGLMTTNGQLITIGSPYSKTGYGYEIFKRFYGPVSDPRILVATGATRDFNSTISAEDIARELERDPAAGQSEWLGLWRQDISVFVSPEVVDNCIIQGRYELPKQSGVRYFGFVDQSGGSSDSFTLCVAHREVDRTTRIETIVIDAIRETKPPFSPDSVVSEYAALLRNCYGIASVVSDKYGGEWIIESFKKHKIRCVQDARPKSDLYREMLPVLNTGGVELLDSVPLRTQLCQLERHVARSGKDSIDHPSKSHDDVANACAGAIALVNGNANRTCIPSKALVAAAGRPVNRNWRFG